MAGKREYFHALTGVRAVMMYGVFNCHFNSIDRAVFGDLIYRFARELHIGVNVFYVLSGFLIYYRYGRDLERLNLHWFDQYLRNRVARIYPVYFLTLLFTYVYAGLPPAEQIFSRLKSGGEFWSWLGVEIGRGFPDFRETVVTFTLTQSFFPDLVKAGISQAWTLTIEETFYFLAPLIFLAALRFGTLAPCLAIAAVGVVVAALPLAGNPYYGQLEHVMGRTICGTIGCFGCGIYLAKVVLRQGPNLPSGRAPWLTYLGLAGATLVLLGVSQLGKLVDPAAIGGKEPRGADHPLGALGIFTAFPALVAVNFYGLMTERSRLRAFLGSRWMVLLGGSSYCFYLIHLGAIQDFLFHRVIGLDRPVLVRNLALFLLINLISVAMFKLIERPANDWIKHLAPRRWWYGVMALAVALLMGIPQLTRILGNGSINLRLLAEDGPYESLQAVLCLVAGVMLAFALVHRAAASRAAGRPLWPHLPLALLTAMLLLMLAEELSWGQRLLGFATPDWLRMRNFQGEATLHNLEWFQRQDIGNLLQTAWLAGVTLYLGLLPLVVRAAPQWRERLARLGVPVAGLPIAATLLAALVFYVLVENHSEMLEASIDVLLVALAVEIVGAAVPATEPASRRSLAVAVLGAVVAMLILLPLQAGEGALASSRSRELVASAAELLGADRRDEAIVRLAEALEVWPQNAEAHFLLARVLLAEEKPHDAIEHLEQGVALAPQYSDGQVLLAYARQKAGETAAAISDYRRILVAHPESAEAANNLAWILATDPRADLRNGPEAIALAQRACQATNDANVGYLDTLAAALAEGGEYTRAQQTAERALVLAREYGDQPRAARIEDRLARYRDRRPYRESAPASAGAGERK